MILEKPQELKSLEELRAFAERFIGAIAKSPKAETATVVGLYGDLGSGKTAFVKCIAEALGIEELVTSPTFVVVKAYTIPSGSILSPRFSKLVHVDAYRLDGGRETRVLGWDEIMANKNNVVFIEWPGNVHDALPEGMINLYFSHVDDGVRRIEEKKGK